MPPLLIALALRGACGSSRREAAQEPGPIENIVAGGVVIDPCVERDSLLVRSEACPAVGVRLHLLERKVMDLKGLAPPACSDELPALRKLVIEQGCR